MANLGFAIGLAKWKKAMDGFFHGQLGQPVPAGPIH
jgi:hypothetical protein